MCGLIRRGRDLSRVAHAYNTRDWQGRNQENHSSRPAWVKSFQDFISTNGLAWWHMSSKLCGKSQRGVSWSRLIGQKIRPYLKNSAQKAGRVAQLVGHLPVKCKDLSISIYIHMWEHNEKTTRWLSGEDEKKMALTKNLPWWEFNLGFLVSRFWEISVCCLYHSFMVFCFSSLRWQRYSPSFKHPNTVKSILTL
jgi:hypothetical protein